MGGFLLNSFRNACKTGFLCKKSWLMQYYKGGALQEEGRLEGQSDVRNSSVVQRTGKVFLFPFMLVLWIVQDIIHKSVEDDNEC
jgi:hypothetical protein